MTTPLKPALAEFIGTFILHSHECDHRPFGAEWTGQQAQYQSDYRSANPIIIPYLVAIFTGGIVAKLPHAYVSKPGK